MMISWTNFGWNQSLNITLKVLLNIPISILFLTLKTGEKNTIIFMRILLSCLTYLPSYNFVLFNVPRILRFILANYELKPRNRASLWKIGKTQQSAVLDLHMMVSEWYTWVPHHGRTISLESALHPTKMTYLGWAYNMCKVLVYHYGQVVMYMYSYQESYLHPSRSLISKPHNDIQMYVLIYFKLLGSSMNSTDF